MADGPYRYSSPSGAPRWRVRYKDEAGAPKSKSFADEGEARDFVSGLRRAASPPAPERLAQDDQRDSGEVDATSATEWRKALAEARETVRSLVRQGEVDPLQAARVLGNIATAAAKYLDQAQLEADIRTIKERIKIMRSARKHGLS